MLAIDSPRDIMDYPLFTRCISKADASERPAIEASTTLEVSLAVVSILRTYTSEFDITEL